MQLFLDTANTDQIREGVATGLITGVTTNPTLIMKEGKDYVETLKEICSIVDGPVSAEPVSLDTAGIVKEGKEFAKLHKNIVIKVPMTPEGMKACRLLTEADIKVNTTLVFSANQALLAAKAGTYFVSPFVGRLDDIGQTGMHVVEEIKQIYDNYNFKTQILVASIRHPIHVKEAALLGADIATVPYAVYENLFKHALTDKGIKRFLDDWNKLQKDLKKR